MPRNNRKYPQPPHPRCHRCAQFHPKLRLLPLGLQSPPALHNPRRPPTLRPVPSLQARRPHLRPTRARRNNHRNHPTRRPGLRTPRRDRLPPRRLVPLQMHPVADVHRRIGVSLAGTERFPDRVHGKVLAGYQVFECGECGEDSAAVLGVGGWTEGNQVVDI